MASSVSAPHSPNLRPIWPNFVPSELSLESLQDNTDDSGEILYSPANPIIHFNFNFMMTLTQDNNQEMPIIGFLINQNNTNYIQKQSMN